MARGAARGRDAPEVPRARALMARSMLRAHAVRGAVVSALAGAECSFELVRSSRFAPASTTSHGPARSPPCTANRATTARAATDARSPPWLRAHADAPPPLRRHCTTRTRDTTHREEGPCTLSRRARAQGVRSPSVGRAHPELRRAAAVAPAHAAQLTPSRARTQPPAASQNHMEAPCRPCASWLCTWLVTAFRPSTMVAGGGRW